MKTLMALAIAFALLTTPAWAQQSAATAQVNQAYLDKTKTEMGNLMMTLLQLQAQLEQTTTDRDHWQQEASKCEPKAKSSSHSSVSP